MTKTETTPEALIEKIKSVRGLVWSHLGNPSLKQIKGVKVTKMPAYEGGGHALSGAFFNVLDDALCEVEKYLEKQHD